MFKPSADNSWVGTASGTPRSVSVICQPFEAKRAVQDVALLKGDELWHRDGQSTRLAFVDQAEADDPIAVGEREGMQQRRIHDAEQPCRGGNPDCEADDSRHAETGTPADGTQCVTQVLPEVFEPYTGPDVPDSVFHLPGPAEFQSCRASCSGLLHAGCAVLVHQQFEMRTYFLVEIALDGTMTPQIAEKRRHKAHGWLFMKSPLLPSRSP